MVDYVSCKATIRKPIGVISAFAVTLQFDLQAACINMQTDRYCRHFNAQQTTASSPGVDADQRLYATIHLCVVASSRKFTLAPGFGRT